MSMFATVRLLVLRHGQSEWNAAQRWQGAADPPLTALGREQARYAGELLAARGEKFAAVWSSGLQRARHTAELVASEMALPAARIESRLHEAHVGEWEGLTAPEIEERWPGYLAAGKRPPGFEPFQSMVDRIFPALRDIAREPAADRFAARLVVAHSGVIRTVVRHLGHTDDRIANLGGVWLLVDPALSFDEPGETAGVTLAGTFDPHSTFVTGEHDPDDTPSAPDTKA